MPQIKESTASIPMRIVGPVKIVSKDWHDLVPIPLATFEAPLWPSTHRGARVCTRAGGISVTLIDDRMTRSIIVEADSANEIAAIATKLPTQIPKLQTLVSQASRFAKLLAINSEIVGNLLYLRFEFFTADAAGHNMTTLAADHLITWLLQTYPALRYVSISGNYCCDKKVSAVNGILGRGKKVIAEVLLPNELCQRLLKTTPEKIVQLHIKKNLIGSLLAGSVRSANAHVANILLAFYLATGQDAANIVEGSQAIVHAEMRDHDLYFSVTLPNIIVGTIGNGKTLPFVVENLRLLACHAEQTPGHNAKRLAMIAACAVLCGELSLLAAQTQPGELIRSHIKLERTGRS